MFSCLLVVMTGSMEITHLDGRKLLVNTKPGEVTALVKYPFRRK